MWLSCETIAHEAQPGQFVILYCKDETRKLGRPISICEIDRQKGMLRLVYRVAGKGTEEFSQLKAADTITVMGPLGNRPPRICEVSDGMLTSIGLQNPGIDVYVKEYIPEIKKACRPDQIIISIGGNEIEDYVATAERIAQVCGENEIAAMEVNGACPNVAHGGGVMSASPEKMYQVVKAVKQASGFPIIGKMNTNFACYRDVARAIQDAGAEAVYLVSTPMGMHIDLKSRRPAIGNIKAPVSGPSILPQAILKTWDIFEEIDIPIIGSGGIYTAEAAIETMMAGAAAVGIGSAQFINPNAAVEILDGMTAYCEQNGIGSFAELIGCAHR